MDPSACAALLFSPGGSIDSESGVRNFQLMEAITRGTGTTRTERVLAKFADRTFLDLWSYPNTFNDRDMGKGQGKELCDLLVVCGRDVIIFSDKDITWPRCSDLDLAWTRWFKRAVLHSVEQIRGAERWLRLYPDRVFIDPECKVRLPVNLPVLSEMRVHGVAVATGARAACSAALRDPDGSLMISSRFRGEEHLETSAEGFLPFVLGDVDPEGSFVHVLDDAALSVVMREMDTIADFIDYLLARETAIRGGRVGIAASEAELVAAYLVSSREDGRHYIPSSDEFGGRTKDPLHFFPGGYQRLKNHSQYRAKKRADQDSYAWDKLIGAFTMNLLGGTSVSVAGHEPSITLAERAVRAMAQENRVNRRALSYAFRGALEGAKRSDQDRFARVVLPTDTSADPECAYVFLIVAFRGEWLLTKGYDYYREGRAGFLKAYCQATLYRFRQLKRVVGIAVDAPSSMTGRRGGSEDLMMMEITEWTPELEEETATLMEEAEILRADRLRAGGLRTHEFPDLSRGRSLLGNRKERRAAEAKARRGPPSR